MCPALQKKPHLDTVSVADDSLAAQGDKDKALDPFIPPYNPNLYVGELRDEGEDEEYVVLVSGGAYNPLKLQLNYGFSTGAKSVEQVLCCLTTFSHGEQRYVSPTYSSITGEANIGLAEFKSQSSPLLPPDLVQTYLLLVAARKADKHFFAFYNCARICKFLRTVG